tara:strand:+ start:62 stop:916 length:855 start_codon:yes stop_codon:yes gene_type:complete
MKVEFAQAATIVKTDPVEEEVTLRMGKAELKRYSLGDEVSLLDRDEYELATGQVIKKGRRKIKVGIDSGFSEIRSLRKITVVKDFDESRDEPVSGVGSEFSGRSSKFYRAHRKLSWGLALQPLGVVSGGGYNIGIKGFQRLDRRSGLNATAAFAFSETPALTRQQSLVVQYIRYAPTGYYLGIGGDIRNNQTTFSAEGSSYAYRYAALGPRASIGRQWLYDKFILDIECVGISAPLYKYASGSTEDDIYATSLDAEELDKHLKHFESVNGVSVWMISTAVGFRF